VLRKLAQRSVEDATYAMREFAEKYADGDRDERYMLGIKRRSRKHPSWCDARVTP